MKIVELKKVMDEVLGFEKHLPDFIVEDTAGRMIEIDLPEEFWTDFSLPPKKRKVHWPYHYPRNSVLLSVETYSRLKMDADIKKVYPSQLLGGIPVYSEPPAERAAFLAWCKTIVPHQI